MSKPTNKTLVNEVPIGPDQSLIPYALLGARVILEHIAPEVTIKDGAASKPIADSKIVLASTVVESYSRGKVLVVGPGNANYPVVVKPGQIVDYFRQQRVPDFEIDGVPYDLVNAADVIGLP